MHSQEETDPIRRELEIEIRSAQPDDKEYNFETCIIRSGPRKWKTGRLMKMVDPETGRPIKTELRFQAFDIRPGRLISGAKPAYEWFCEDDEIEMVRHFLTEHHDPGRYALVNTDNGIESMLDLLTGKRLDPAEFIHFLEFAQEIPGLASTLATSGAGALLARSVEIERRRAALKTLRQIVENSSSNEHDIHRELKGQAWIFGGNYIGEFDRRQLFTGGILDIPLIRGDGSLHIVELKQANIPKLVVAHREGHIVGPDVNEAVGQVQNYLRALDEKRADILVDFKVDARRAHATVLLGDSRRVANIERQTVLETIRVYNSHLSRIEVMTYDQLLDSADRAVDFARDKHTSDDNSFDPDIVDFKPPF